MFDNPRGGIGYAAEFQSAGLPFVTSSAAAPATGSPTRIDFPKVCRTITIVNRGTTTDSLSFGFTRAGVVSSNNKFIVNAGQALTFELRVTSLWLQSESGTPAFSLCAGLTNIDARQMPALSGTLPDGSPGWIGVG